jgi:SAM-dependent methyltransferase
MFGRILSKLRKSCEERGIVGTVRHVLKRIAYTLVELTPARRRYRRLKEEKDRAFDTRHGVDTGGIIQLNQLRIAGSSWEYGVPYWAIDPDDFARLVGALDIRHPDFTFIDFGSGKGRALLLASEFPFEKIIGVEFSPELTEIARQNIRTFRSERQQCHKIELVCADVLEYPLPNCPAVYYFYNPFDREIMERVVARIEQSYRERPREIYVLYANPQHDDTWERASIFRKIAETGDYTIYHAKP